MKIKIFSKNSAVLFSRTADGREIFYPWRYPGEALYVTPKQKRCIKTIIVSLSVVFGIIVLGAVFTESQGLIDSSAIDYAIASSIMILTFTYWGLVHFIAKGTAFYLVPVEQRPNKTSRTPWMILFVQAIATQSLFANNTATFFLWGFIALSCIYIIYTAYLTVIIDAQKGYYLSRKKE